MVVLTNKGYIKRIVSETYKTQNRGGVGVKGMSTNEEDFVENILSLTTHDYVKLDNVESFDTQEYISLWNVYEIDEVKIIKKLSNAKKESVLIQKWLESKLTTINANHALYEKICPICKSREVEVIKNKYHCDNCKSSYVLFKKKNKEKIWLTKIRRV